MDRSQFAVIRKSFFEYFESRGYKGANPFKIDDSDSKSSFVRSLNTKPAYAYHKHGEFFFGASRASISQPAVRPEDFLPLDIDARKLPKGAKARLGYRCGIFDMLAIWGTNEQRQPSQTDEPKFANELSGFYRMLQDVLTFMEDAIGLDRKKMWFSLWPGGSVANGHGHIPKDELSESFLLKTWNVSPEQISWDDENIWPDVANQGILDPERTGLMGPRLEMYYQVSGSQDKFPRSTSDCGELGFMELISAIPIAWIHDGDSGEFRNILGERAVFEIAFGLERLCVCAEGVSRVHDIGFFGKLRTALNECILVESDHQLFPDNEKGDLLFSKTVDRLRFSILAASQGIMFDDQGKGSTLKRTTQDLFDLLTQLGLNDIQVLRIILTSIDHFSEFYPEIERATKSQLGNCLLQSLTPSFVMGKKYSVGEGGSVDLHNVVYRRNKGDIRKQVVIPELN